VYLLWLIVQTASVLVYLWFVTLPAIIFIGVCLYHERCVKAERRCRALYVWLPLCVPLPILVVGTIFRHRPDAHYKLPIPDPMVWPALFVVLVCSYCVYRASSRRTLAVAVSLLSVELALAAFFVAGMSISGDWL